MEQYYAPDFELNVRASNMENSNSREYLDKITAAVIDNLRQTGPAPSVQMQDVPRKPFGGMTDEEEAELDDLDEDENKDVRMTEHRWDKHVENGAEFEASDDDEMAAAHGATRNNGNKRSFNNFKDTDGAEERGSKSPKDKETDSNKETAEPEGHDVNDDTIEDVGAAEEPEKEAPEEEKDEQDSKQQKVDADGDVGMEDSTATEEATIKKEEGEPESVPEAEKESEKPAEEKTVEAEPEKPTETKQSTETKADEPLAEAETEKPAESDKKAEENTEEKTEENTGDKPAENEGEPQATTEPEAMEVDEKEKTDDKAEDDSSK